MGARLNLAAAPSDTSTPAHTRTRACTMAITGPAARPHSHTAPNASSPKQAPAPYTTQPNNTLTTAAAALLAPPECGASAAGRRGPAAAAGGLGGAGAAPGRCTPAPSGG